MNVQLACPVCDSRCAPLDTVDFNKSCEELRGNFLAPAGMPVHYHWCPNCRFCFAPEFARWALRDFAEKIYNQDYIRVDPDYLEVRPRQNAQNLVTLFKERGREIKHLDYGGGNGLLSRILQEANWQSTSFDPFVNQGVDPGTLGRFDLVTAFEVFEHVPDVRELITTLSLLLAPNGVVLFSTLVSDGHIAPNQRLTWWYASPRNGHISLFSKKSLALLGARGGFKFGSFTDGFHAFCTQVPPWARHVLLGG